MKTSPPHIAALVGAGLAALALSQAASAASQPYSSFSIRPISASEGFFVLEGKRRAKLAGTVRIVNTGTKTGTVGLYSVDATTGATTGAVYLGRNVRRRGVGRWIRLPLSRLTLRPAEARTVRFSLLVPRKAQPGHHLGGIVAENLELTSGGGKRSKSSGLQIRVRHLSIVAVQVNLPGRRLAGIAFRGVKVGVSAGYEVLYLALRTTGNVLVRPRLEARVTNSKGLVVARRSLQLDTFVPRTKIGYPLYLLEKPLPPGRYRLSGTLSYVKRVTRFSALFEISPELVRQLPPANQPAPVQQAERTLSASNPWAIGGAALVIGLILGLLVVKLRPLVSR